MQKPAAACIREVCLSCELQDKLMCVHKKQDLFGFAVLFLNVFAPFILGMIDGGHLYGILVWLTLCIIFFGYVESLILCRHCPHYKEEGNILRCHANWGLPKIPKIDPRRMNKTEQVVWLIYAVLIVFFLGSFLYIRWTMDVFSLGFSLFVC